MTLNDFLFGALLYLAAAVASALVAARLGLGSVLGFLVAGAKEAKLLIIAIDDPEKITELVKIAEPKEKP